MAKLFLSNFNPFYGVIDELFVPEGLGLEGVINGFGQMRVLKVEKTLASLCLSQVVNFCGQKF